MSYYCKKRLNRRILTQGSLPFGLSCNFPVHLRFHWKSTQKPSSSSSDDEVVPESSDESEFDSDESESETILREMASDKKVATEVSLVCGRSVGWHGGALYVLFSPLPGEDVQVD